MPNILLLFGLILSNTLVQASLKFSSQDATLKLSGPAAQIILSTPITDFSGTLKISDKSGTSIQATTTSDLLTFANGVYQSGTTGRAFVNATLDPSTTDTLILADGQNITVDNGSVIEALLVKGEAGNICGQPTFNSPIILQDGATSVTLSIQNKLNQSIILNGGVIFLGNDLALQDGVFLSGDGAIDLSYKTLTLPAAMGTGWSGSLLLRRANDLNLTGFTQLTGTWTFEGSGATSCVNGNGCVLDISGGGVLNIGGDHTLYLSDLHIKGLGANGGSINISDGGTLTLSNVVLELAGSYDLTSGTINIAGNNCTVIAKNSDNFNISGPSSILNVDGVALLYDPLGTAPLVPNPFVTNSGGSITYANGGTIRASYGGGSGGSIEFTIPTTSGTETLPSNQNLSPSGTMTFLNEDIGTPKEITLNGQGFYVQFNYTTGQYLTINENTTVILKNMLLKDFDPALIDFQGTGATKAKIIFGDNATVSLASDLTISSAPLTFTGNATLRGNNTTLTLSAANMLTANGANKTLTVKNLRLFLSNATAMQCVNSDTSKFVLQDSEVHMTSIGATFAKGHLDIKNNVSLFGADETSTSGSSTFTFSSKGLLTILSDSSLSLENGTSFAYSPDTTNDADATASKRHLILTDPSASLSLDGCTVTTSTAGFALDYGRLLVDGKTTLHINATDGAEVEFGSALLVQLAPSAILDIDGALKYTETVYPPTITPPATGVPVNYGDAIMLQHANYHTYLKTTTDWYTKAMTTLPTSDLGKFFVVTTEAEYRFASPEILGQPVRSGDWVSFESLGFQNHGLTDGAPTQEYFPYYLLSDFSANADVSTPRPPYCETYPEGCLVLWGNVQVQASRIYKYGAAVGDPIYQGDSVYLVNWQYSSNTPAVGSIPIASSWLGSANLDFQDGKEVFAYLYSNLNATPPNFTRDFIWKVVNVAPAAYQSAISTEGLYVAKTHTSAYNTNDTNCIAYKAAYEAALPAASSYQF